MITTEPGGEFVATCNECGHESYGGCLQDFRAFVASLREDGWKIVKDGDEWKHSCQRCQE